MNEFLFRFRSEGYLTVREYNRYTQAYNAPVLAQANIFRLPTPEEISYSLQDSDYARFYKKSNRIMKFFLLYFSFGFLTLIFLLLVRDFILR